MGYCTLDELKSYLDINDSDTFVPGDVDTGNDTITLGDVMFVDQRLKTATEVVLESSETPADLPAPLAEDTTYYVILDADLTIQLATSSANAEAGTAIDITDTGTGTHTIQLAHNDDALLEGFIERVEKAIDNHTNRTFEAVSATRSYGRTAVDGLWLWLSADLYELTSVANGDSAGTAIDTDDITEFPMDIGPPYHKLRLDSNSSSSWQVDTDYWITVTGDWGYSDSAPNDVVQATIRWAAYLYRQKDTGQFETVAVSDAGALTVPMGMPEDVRVMLSPYRRHSL